ncbi:hypothetical protein [Phyllobacterium sp. OV277]|jgi:hypothetical protein|uniref:hypothetical protein n=1 Tax=Phyllobacterium sp. OV277 TaxID=1882772 RepID=UPI00088594AF|nr:hypothetical protein [Phyllobacterium sp. OV277]SDP91899.1 hypothetical protein SAMN05443582_12012 [Phyllobacterium sp. OV277]
MAIKFTAKDPATSERPAPAKAPKPEKIEQDAAGSDAEAGDSDLFNATSKTPARKRKGK